MHAHCYYSTCLFFSACVHLEWCPPLTAFCSCNIELETEGWETEVSWSHRRLAVSAFGTSVGRHTLMVSGTKRGKMGAERIPQTAKLHASEIGMELNYCRPLTEWGRWEHRVVQAVDRQLLVLISPPFKMDLQTVRAVTVRLKCHLASRLYHSWQPTTMSLSRSHLCLVVWDPCTLTNVNERARVHLYVCLYCTHLDFSFFMFVKLQFFTPHFRPVQWSRAARWACAEPELRSD